MNIITMVLIFIVVRAFSGIVDAAGGVESTVNFRLSIIPPHLMGVAHQTGFPITICIGAVVCGTRLAALWSAAFNCSCPCEVNTVGHYS